MILMAVLLTLSAAQQPPAAPPVSLEDVPDWALADAETWIAGECPDEAAAVPLGPCRRAARNRLALARAERQEQTAMSSRVAQAAPTRAVQAPPVQRCRWIRGTTDSQDENERSVGAALTRVCSDDPNDTGQAARAVLESLFRRP